MGTIGCIIGLRSATVIMPITGYPTVETMHHWMMLCIGVITRAPYLLRTVSTRCAVAVF